MADKNVIYNAEVKVELDSKELKKGVKEAKKEAKKLEDEKVKVDVDEKQADGFLKKLKKMRDGLRSFAFDAKTNAGLIKMTPQAKELYTNWLAATKSVEQYKATHSRAQNTKRKNWRLTLKQCRLSASSVFSKTRHSRLS